MVDISTVGTALYSLLAAKDVARTMIGLRDGAVFQEKLIEFQYKIIDAKNAAFAAQDERTAMLQCIGQLKKQSADLKVRKFAELLPPTIKR